MLTDLLIKNRKPSNKREEVPDGRIGGLYLVVQPSGAKSWAVRYRVAGKPKKLTIGAYPGIDLATARKRAQEALGGVAGGNDPAAEKQAAKAAKRVPADRDLVEKVVASFIERYAKTNTRETSWRETERILNREVVGAWKGRQLSRIGRADVHELLDGIVDRDAPIVANRTLAALRRMCGWAVERGIVTTSPCDGVKAPSAERSRDRVLLDDELRLVWWACETIGWPFGPLVRLLILTGQRRDEVAAMRWSEVDLEAGLWTIPKERVKNGVAHTVPLSAAAVEVLSALPRIKGGHGYVFTTTGDSPVAGFSRAKDRLSALILAEIRKSDPEAEKPPRWTLRDLRRTLASGMARLGVNLPVIEKVLNHTSGSFAGIVGVYQRHSFADEKRQALDLWSGFVERLVSESPASNVVELQAAQ